MLKMVFMNKKTKKHDCSKKLIRGGVGVQHPINFPPLATANPTNKTKNKEKHAYRPASC